MRRVRAISLIGAGLMTLATASKGQGTTAVAVPPSADSVAPRIHPDGSLLSQFSLTYVATLQQPTGARILGERSIQLARTSYAGASAWAIVETRGAGATASSDTVVADAASLVPLHWGAVQQVQSSNSTGTSARLSIEFRSDSMIGVIIAPTGRRTIVEAVPPGSLVSAGQTEVYLHALPVGTGWQDSTWVVVTDAARTTVVPAQMAVVGQEIVATTTGPFDCWIVALSTPVGTTRYWVSKGDRTIVKTSQILPESGDVLEYLLVRSSH